MTHDPLKFANALGTKLATRSRHVCLFLGAGAARACGLPDVKELQAKVLADLDKPGQEQLTSQLDGRNIEQALSRLRRISGLITGDQKVDGLTAADAAALDLAVCQAIIRALDIENADLTPVRNLAAWSKRADYRLPVEIFTVNYDLLLETALESQGVPYFDGFVGNLRARFRTELVEAIPGSDGENVPSLFVRLWKLHGSVNWVRDNDHQIVRIGYPAPKDHAAAIYPSDTKYEESRRVPFIVLQDRLRRALHHPETIVLVAGYSFGDAHLNELLFDAASRRERSEFVVFCHSSIPEILADRAGRTPNLQIIGGREAILSGLQAEWKPPPDTLPNLWDDGHLALKDFQNLAAYLARSVSRETEPMQEVRETGSASGSVGGLEDSGNG